MDYAPPESRGPSSPVAPYDPPMDLDVGLLVMPPPPSTSRALQRTESTDAMQMQAATGIDVEAGDGDVGGVDGDDWSGSYTYSCSCSHSSWSDRCDSGAESPPLRVCRLWNAADYSKLEETQASSTLQQVCTLTFKAVSFFVV